MLSTTETQSHRELLFWDSLWLCAPVVKTGAAHWPCEVCRLLLSSWLHTGEPNLLFLKEP